MSPGRIGGCLPFHDAPAARSEHAARLSGAQVALREGRPARMAEVPRVAVREDVTSQTGSGSSLGDDDLGQELVEALPRRGPDLGAVGGG